jgi:hypothetical protein
MLEIRPGAIIVGNSGKSLVVDRVEGDLLICGERQIGIEAVVKFIPPRPKTFKSGDKVEYIGTDKNLITQYDGILEIRTMGSGGDRDKCSCYTSDKLRVTSWIDYSDLELAGQTIDGDYFTEHYVLRTPQFRC